MYRFALYVWAVNEQQHAMNLHEIARQAFYGCLPATNALAMSRLSGVSHVSISDVEEALLLADANELEECIVVDGGIR